MKSEATPARTHGQATVGPTLSDRIYTPTLIRPVTSGGMGYV